MGLSFSESLTPDEVGVYQVAMIIIIALISIFGSLWFASNITDPDIRSNAMFYWPLGMLGLGGSIFGFIAVKSGADFDVVTLSKQTAFGELSGWKMAGMILLCVFMGLTIFYNIGTVGSSAVIYDTVQMQVVHLGAWGNAAASFCFAVAEEWGMVAFFTGIIYWLAWKLSKGNWVIALLATLLGVAFIFAVPYHFLRYGFVDMVATMKIFGMTMISVGWMLFLRNMLLGLFVHGFNNAAITFFSKAAVAPAVVFMDMVPILAVIGIVVVVYAWWYKRDESG